MSFVKQGFVRRGDTIIEILFATAIFGAVAISAVSLMNATLGAAEGNLEQTITRNEIDAQAEAIRFIHGAYITERDSGAATGLSEAWNSITSRALDPTNDTNAAQIANFPVSTCSAVYDKKSNALNKAFVINTKNLGSGKAFYTPSTATFQEAPIYPRVFLSDSKVVFAEGIWDLIVKSDSSAQPEFYDFYIRSCWYPPNSSTPTTLGTVIRLHNPDYGYAGVSGKTDVASNEYKVNITLDPNGGKFEDGNSQPKTSTSWIRKNSSVTIPNTTLTNGNYTFKGWSTTQGASTAVYKAGGEIAYSTFARLSDNWKNEANLTLYAVWGDQVNITYDCNGGVDMKNPSSSSRTYSQGKNESFTIASNDFFCSKGKGYKFIGWSKNKYEVGNKNSYNSDNRIDAGSTYKISEGTTLYAVWAFEGIYQFRSKLDTNYVLDVKQQVDENGTQVILYKAWPLSNADDSRAERFRVSYNTSGDYYTILWTAKSGNEYSLDANGGVPSTGDSTTLIIHSLHSEANQQWLIERSADDSYYIALAGNNTDSVLDINGCKIDKSDSGHTPVYVYRGRNSDCGKGNHQRWSLKYIGTYDPIVE